jgi:hypothetical protein
MSRRACNVTQHLVIWRWVIFTHIHVPVELTILYYQFNNSLRMTMAWKTPMVSEGVLRMPLDAITIPIGSTAWYTWLADDMHCSFHFSHPSGGFTARKERKQRGQRYWIAYRHARGKLYKTYLGKGEVLTEDRLCAAAHTLARTVDTHGEGAT